jgi:uncharacterized protein YraI
MKSAHLLLAVAAATVLIPVTSFAQQMVMANAVLDLNMRAGPDPVYPVVAVIPINAEVTIYGCNEGRSWCDVQWGPNRGWAYAEYLVIQTVPVPQVVQAPPPVVVYQPEPYFTQHYQTQAFYNDRNRFFGAAGGAATGATIGALIFGPVGAAVGAAVGGAFGAVVIPPQVVTYVQTQPLPQQPILLQGEVVVGAIVPPAVQLTPVPDYAYAYAYINGQWVLVDPTSRQIMFVIRG